MQKQLRQFFFRSANRIVAVMIARQNTNWSVIYATKIEISSMNSISRINFTTIDKTNGSKSSIDLSIGKECATSSVVTVDAIIDFGLGITDRK